MFDCMVNRYTVFAICVLLSVTARVAFAQDYPTRAIRLVVPSTAGGTSDILSRIIAPKLGEALGQQIVVDNRAGASTTIGVAVVAKAAPDGYTIGISPAALAINPSIFRKL